MTIEQRFAAALVADANLAALIGDRLYLVQIPQAPGLVYPAVAYQRISTTRQYTQNYGATQATEGWVRFQLTVFGAGPSGGDQALSVSGAIIDALRVINLTGVSGSAPGRVIGQHVEIDARPTNQPIFKVVMDVQIFFGRGDI